ncbi:hypothetical protein BH10ACI2_BH10ACI2_22220 [soil metagenome]
MNVFEDLVAELQEENLLESTYLDDGRSQSEPPVDRIETAVPVSQYDLYPNSEPEIEDYVEPPDPVAEPSQSFTFDAANLEDLNFDESDFEIQSEPEFEIQRYETEDLHGTARPPASAAVELMSMAEQVTEVEQTPIPAKPKNGREFYKKRAVGEISNLQMVEHVLTGVEREYMKIVPHVFDDFNAKKALHTFLQVTDNENSTAHAESEFTLMTETEAWCSALATRDREIQVPSLRHYCENSRPALSSQALLALARFYRNLPYSEAVRSKFDFVITRLFSRPTENEKRVCLFTRDEMFVHINTLYKDWSSVALYSADGEDSNEMLTALSFEDLAVEAERATNFDQLIECEFFNRLRLFKESISEMFYAPNVTAAAIDANVRIGNAYVDLIDRERQKMDIGTIQSKYGSLHDSAVSDAAARTLHLVELLRTPPKPAPSVQIDSDPYHVEPADDSSLISLHRPEPESLKETSQLPPIVGKLAKNAKSVNRGFLAVCGFLILVSVGIYVWANFFVSESIPKSAVQALDVDSTQLKGFSKTARISGDNCYFMMQPTWDQMPRERRREILQKAYAVSREKGCSQVSLMSKDGKVTGFASATRLDVVGP